jgi:ABC-type Zn2+ transport system substrate-binding protein/surface adhesin
MIKTQELKTQMDELTKQNELVLTQLAQVKSMLTQSENGHENKNSSNDSSSDGQESDGKSEHNGQENSKQKSDNIPQLANDLLAIKDLVEKLEKKTSQYITSQTSGSLTEKDMVNLILTMMNGMVDWTTEFVSGKNSQSKQQQ